MLKQFSTATLLFICLITPGIAIAQGRDRIEVQIPFSFVVREQTLPAGKYVVERTDPGRPNILTLTSVDNSIVRVVLAQRVEKNDPSTASSLIFILRDDRFYLFQIWKVGSINGVQVPSALDKRSNERQSPALVTLRVEDRP